MNIRLILITLLLLSSLAQAQQTDPYKPVLSEPDSIPGMSLAWHDEFNNEGRPDSANWIYEHGFVRNRELQWYQPDNAYCTSGVLVITGKKEQVKNPGYISGSTDWKQQRAYAEYTSTSMQTRNRQQFQYGRFEIRARIDTSKGSWPAIWTLGTKGTWPSNGEIDIMEFYRVKSIPTILANVAWGTNRANVAKWDDARVPLSEFTVKDPAWNRKFHTWRMDWSKESINLFLDDRLMNTTDLRETLNADGSNPFFQPHYLMLNLALGGNGDDPSQSVFPIKYEVDYLRVYQYGNR